MSEAVETLMDHLKVMQDLALPEGVKILDRESCENLSRGDLLYDSATGYYFSVELKREGGRFVLLSPLVDLNTLCGRFILVAGAQQNKSGEKKERPQIGLYGKEDPSVKKEAGT